MWRNLAGLPRLEVVWLVEPALPVGRRVVGQAINVKRMYFTCEEAAPAEAEGDVFLEKRFTVAVLGDNSWYDKAGWKELDPDKRMTVRLFSMFGPGVPRVITLGRLGSGSFARGPLWDLRAAEGATLCLPFF